MPKVCLVPECQRNVFAKLYCPIHQYLRTDKQRPKPIAVKPVRTPIKKRPKPIKKTSKKRGQINRVYYEPKARAHRHKIGHCEVCPVLRKAGFEVSCSGEAECIHHVKGKATIELLLDENWWLCSCFWGNNWIEANSDVAKLLKLKVPDYSSKLSNL